MSHSTEHHHPQPTLSDNLVRIFFAVFVSAIVFGLFAHISHNPLVVGVISLVLLVVLIKWREVFFSFDHKVIGVEYGITALCFLLFGFCLMMLMRWQLAYPGQPLPLIGRLFGEDNMPGGVMVPDFYNQLGAMHGTIMVFMGVVPLAVGAFGNVIVPLQIGAVDMAFPRLNMASYWAFFVGGVIMIASFFVHGGTAASGWTSYSPLADISIGSASLTPYSSLAEYFDKVIFTGQTMWIFGMIFLITSSLLGSVNFIVTIFQLRAPGLTFMRLSFFVHAQLVTSFLLLLAFPPLEGAAILHLMDRIAGTSFFLPTGLVVSGQQLHVAGGGNALLWQHLFWFLAHPEVYVLILPAMGIITEIIANNIRKPIWGYKPMVYSVIFIGFMSFIVWAHHMFLTNMGTVISAFFQATTMIISVPSVVILTCLFISLWGGSIRFNTPMLFALAFLPMFGIGGLTGLPLGLATPDIHLHDTYYVIGHFHYIVAPGTIFALFAGIYYWFPKLTGRKMNEILGQLHFWPSFICMNFIFMPMMIQGLAGVSRRLYDGGASYAHAQPVLYLNVVISIAAWIMGLAQIFFIINVIGSIWAGKKAESDNPWEATTLEWDAPNCPPHGNFTKHIEVYRGPYEYSVPGSTVDFTPQSQKEVK
jgi:cytochrome c oxidase subunit 1